MPNPGYRWRAGGGTPSGSTPLGTHTTGTLGYFAASTSASCGVFVMTPSAARKARRSSRGVSVRNTRVPSRRCDCQTFGIGPAHGSRRSINQCAALPIVASPATRWAECGGPLLTTTCGWNRRITDRARSAARRIQPWPSSGKAKNVATSLRIWRSRPRGQPGVVTRDRLRDNPSDSPKTSRRSSR